MNKQNNLNDIHQKALLNFDRIQSAVRSERKQCLEDRRFYSIAGAMWEGKLGEQFANKPKFEINKIHLSVIKIINEYRNNRITVKFIPKDGVKNDKLSDALNGLYRSDEADSVADEAYDNGFEEAVGGGMGAFRLTAQYEDDTDEENENQRIKFNPIFDADSSVFFDLNAKRQDKADAKFCFVITSMEKQSYIDTYDDDPKTWNKEITQDEFDWDTPDIVYIAEYYEIEEKFETRIIYESLDGEKTNYTKEDFENDASLKRKLKAMGSRKVREKKIKVRRCHKYIMSGGKILSDEGYIAGSNIPIIPIYGKRWFIDNIERCMGHVRLCKDSQRLKNMQTSKLAEISALSTVEKPILTPQQVAGLQTYWQDDNIENYPYMLLNPMTDKEGNDIPAQPLGYTRVANIPPSMAALLSLTDNDMKEILGNQQQNEDIVSNISGKAVELIQNKIDMQTYIYMSNMAKAIKRSGEVWLSMAKELYVDQGRKMKIIGTQKEIDSIEIKKPFMNQETGEIEYQNDLSSCNMGVMVSVGPSSDSRRAATVNALTQMMMLTQNDPETQNVLTSMAMMNMEGEGIEEVREYFRKRLVSIGAVKPNQEELEQMKQNAENQIPDANTQYLQAAAMEAQAKAQKNQADTLLNMAKVEETQAETEKTKAETIETISDISTKEREQAVNAVQALETTANFNPDNDLRRS